MSANTRPYSIKTMQDVGEVICFNGVPIEFDLVVEFLNKYNIALEVISKTSQCKKAKKIAVKALGDHYGKIIDDIQWRNAAGNLLL